MKLYRKPDSPFWWVDFIDPLDNKRVRKSTKFSAVTTKPPKEVVTYAAKLLEDRRKVAIYGEREQITVKETLQGYLKSKERSSAYAQFKSRIDSLLGLRKYQGLPPERALSKITSGDVERLIEDRLSQGLSHNSINNEIVSLLAAVNRADRLGFAAPKLKIKKLKTKAKLRWLTLDEEQKLLLALDPARLVGKTSPEAIKFAQDAYDLVVVLLDTGARYSEAAAISWDCVDTVNWQHVNIYRTKVGNDGQLALTKRLRAILKRRYVNRGNSHYVFPGRTPGEHRAYATAAIRKAIERAKLNPKHLVDTYGRVTAHTMRDTFASRLAQAGVSLQKIAFLLGHSDVKMAQKYAHLCPLGAAQEAVSVLDGLQVDKKPDLKLA